MDNSSKIKILVGGENMWTIINGILLATYLILCIVEKKKKGDE